MQHRAQWAIWPRALSSLSHSTMCPLRYNTHTSCVPKRCCLIWVSTNSSSCNPHRFRRLPHIFFLKPQARVGAIHTHICEREWVRVCACVYVCNCVLSPHLLPTPYSFWFSHPPDPISLKGSFSTKEPFVIGLFPRKSPIFHSSFLRNRNVELSRSFVAVASLSLSLLLHTGSGHIPHLMYVYV